MKNNFNLPYSQNHNRSNGPCFGWRPRLPLRFVFPHLGFGDRCRHPPLLQKIPLPFTVLLLLIGLGMGALNRAYIEGDGHGLLSMPIKPLVCGPNC